MILEYPMFLDLKKYKLFGLFLINILIVLKENILIVFNSIERKLFGKYKTIF